MKDELHTAIRAAAKGRGWSVKWDILAKRLDDWVLAIHPRRDVPGLIGFTAKPVAWDHLLRAILQIPENERKPVSFYFTGAFTCRTPTLIQENIGPLARCDEVADQMLVLATRCLQAPHTWQQYDLDQAVADERPERPYDYHMTRVVERICLGDKHAAHKVCEAALGGELDIRYSFSSYDRLAPLNAEGRRTYLSFFELAKIWMSRH